MFMLIDKTVCRAGSHASTRRAPDAAPEGQGTSFGEIDRALGRTRERHVSS
jgi:hypothetical protein